MAEYIERDAQYREAAELEELARNRVLQTPTASPAYSRYVAQLNERTALKHRIADAPAADVEPVRHGRWEVLDHYRDGDTAERCSQCRALIFFRCMTPKNYCPNCGAKMSTPAD